MKLNRCVTMQTLRSFKRNVLKHTKRLSSAARRQVGRRFNQVAQEHANLNTFVSAQEMDFVLRGGSEFDDEFDDDVGGAALDQFEQPKKHTPPASQYDEFDDEFDANVGSAALDQFEQQKKHTPPASQYNEFDDEFDANVGSAALEQFEQQKKHTPPAGQNKKKAQQERIRKNRAAALKKLEEKKKKKKGKKRSSARSGTPR